MGKELNNVEKDVKHHLSSSSSVTYVCTCIIQQGRLSAEKLQDERCNRVSSVLIGLGTVMCVSPVCEKKTMFAVCQMIKEKNIEKDLVLQVILLRLPLSRELRKLIF